MSLSKSEYVVQVQLVRHQWGLVNVKVEAICYAEAEAAGLAVVAGRLARCPEDPDIADIDAVWTGVDGVYMTGTTEVLHDTDWSGGVHIDATKGAKA